MKDIYSLDDPETGDPRYIGQTQNAPLRIKAHRVKVQYGGSSARDRWVASLQQRGLQPVYRVLETVADDEADEAEGRWIFYGRTSGWQLTNRAPPRNAGNKYDSYYHAFLRYSKQSRIPAEFSTWPVEQRTAYIDQLRHEDSAPARAAAEAFFSQPRTQAEIAAYYFGTSDVTLDL